MPGTRSRLDVLSKEKNVSLMHFFFNISLATMTLTLGTVRPGCSTPSMSQCSTCMVDMALRAPADLDVL